MSVKKTDLDSLRNNCLLGMKLCSNGEYNKAVDTFKKAYYSALSINEKSIASIMIHYICFCYTNLADPDSMITFCDSEKNKHGEKIEVGIFSFYYSIACLFKEQYEKAADIARAGIEFEQKSHNLKIIHPAYYYEIAYRAYSALGL